MTRLVILGSTGSIGRQTLDVVRSQADDFSVLGLAADGNADLLAQQAAAFKPQSVCLRTGFGEKKALFSATLLEGSDGLIELATNPEADLIVIAIPGLAALQPTLAAIEAGKVVALASKEPLFVAGELVMEKARRNNVVIVPVDSEPSAIWQCLLGESEIDCEKSKWMHDVFGTVPVNRLVLTASGGSLRNLRYEQLCHVTPEMVLKHPTWQMGTKVTIDSATLLNKGMEIVEAHWLFGVDWSMIEAVIHPQSIVHSLVEFMDGSIKAQLSRPDMRLFIQYALNYMKRAQGIIEYLDLCRVATLTFEMIDQEKYPCFSIAIEAAKAGGTYAAVVNAADEELIGLFIRGVIRFDQIPVFLEKVLDMHENRNVTAVKDIEAADEWTRRSINKLARM